jgi:GAF domain-containing protein
VRRRSKAGSEPVKARRRKTAKLKRRITARAASRRSSGAANKETEVARLKRELHEALERQTATSEVLKVISNSPGELQPIFSIILKNALRICKANFATLLLCEGDAYRVVATHNAPPAYVEAIRLQPMLGMTGDTGLARVARTKRPDQVADVAAEPGYRNDPNPRRFVALTGARSLLTVPMLKDDALTGAIGVYRQEVRPFTDKQVALVQNFAAQAVIALENTRLLGELRQSLEQQTATSEVLGVISSSPGDLAPVFQTMLSNATRICGAKSEFSFDTPTAPIPPSPRSG